MSKRHHRQTGSGRQDNDKPDYAADYPVRKAKPSNKVEEDKTHVKEHLQGNVVQELNRLKASLQEEQASDSDKTTGKSTPTAKPHSNVQRGTKNRTDEVRDEDKSFAELFEPEEEDDTSFEDMLKNSKMDWRKFK